MLADNVARIEAIAFEFLLFLESQGLTPDEVDHAIVTAVELRMLRTEHAPQDTWTRATKAICDKFRVQIEEQEGTNDAQLRSAPTLAPPAPDEPA